MDSKTIFTLLETDEAVVEAIDKLAKQFRPGARWQTLYLDPASASLVSAPRAGHYQVGTGTQSNSPGSDSTVNRVAERIMRRYGLMHEDACVLASGLHRGALLVILDAERQHASRFQNLLRRVGGRIVATVDSASITS